MARTSARPAWERDDSAITRPKNGIEKHASAGSSYLQGYVATSHGFVMVYSQGHDGKYQEASRFEIILGGRLYALRESRARSARSLVTRADQFAHEVADEIEEEG